MQSLQKVRGKEISKSVLGQSVRTLKHSLYLQSRVKRVAWQDTMSVHCANAKFMSPFNM